MCGADKAMLAKMLEILVETYVVFALRAKEWERHETGLEQAGMDLTPAQEQQGSLWDDLLGGGGGGGRGCAERVGRAPARSQDLLRSLVEVRRFHQLAS